MYVQYIIYEDFMWLNNFYQYTTYKLKRVKEILPTSLEGENSDTSFQVERGMSISGH